MKVLWAFLLLASSAVAIKIQLQDGNVSKKLPEFNIDGKGAAWVEFQEMIEKEAELSGDRYIELDLSRFADIIIRSLQIMIFNAGLDPLKLANRHITYIPSATLELSNGQFAGLSTLGKSGPVIGRYTFRKKILEVILPMAYENLLITYDYSTRLGLVRVDGAIKSKVTNFRLKLRFGIDFTTLHVFADDIDVTDTGSFEVEITGLGSFEYLTDLIIESITEVFHSIILEAINVALQIPINAAVDAINEKIDELLGRNSTEVLLESNCL